MQPPILVSERFLRMLPTTQGFTQQDTSQASHTAKPRIVKSWHIIIPTALAYGVYIYQLIRYSRACGSYQNLEATEPMIPIGEVEVITSKVLPQWLG